MKENKINPFTFSTYSPSSLYSHFQTTSTAGLSSHQLPVLRSLYGPNSLPLPPQESLCSKIKSQFSDILVIILIIAAIISFITNITTTNKEDLPPWIEPFVIVLILIMNTIIGIYQDFNAENALKALNELNIAQANVLRDSIWQIVLSKELVPGDIVKLNTGNKVPADIRILEINSRTLLINQAILTGESGPVNKTFEIMENYHEFHSIFDMNNLLFSGTLVVQGHALGLVIATGPNTQIGTIQKEVISADNEEIKTPLREKLNEFGDKLAKVIGVLCVIIWFLNIKNFADSAYGSWFEGALHYFKIAVSLAVAAIPEGLPAVITTCLALGTRRMAKRNAIVRNLTSVETLGCTNVICTDKTGTLTTNEMCVKHFSLLCEEKTISEENTIFKVKDYEVEGCDYSLEGGVSNVSINDMENLRVFCEGITLCNESRLIYKETKGKNKRISVIGLPLEGALRVLVEKIGRYLCNEKEKFGLELDQFAGIFRKDFEYRQTYEFTSERKLMTVICEDPFTKEKTAFIKGAPEILLGKSGFFIDQNGRILALDNEKKQKVLKRIKDYCTAGFRCLGVGFKRIGKKETGEEVEEVENDVVFVGLVAMEDPARPEVKGAIELCRKAGIKLIMVTGDLKETAQSIAVQLGMIKTKEPNNFCFSGFELETMTPAEQSTLMDNFIQNSYSIIFYRLEPRHKRLLVTLLNKKGQVVAMTGDGVNDAPALKQADIGIAMGLTGTEVAKEASDMVLADDNFGTIVKAIEEGRAIFDNMKAFIRYMISSNIGEVVAIFLGSILGIPDIFSSVQLLWVNLVTDGMPAMALSFNKPDADVMIRGPRHRNDSLITKWIFTRYLIIGTYVGLATVGIFLYWYLYYSWSSDSHSLITFSQLSSYTSCPSWENFTINSFQNLDFGDKNCGYFSVGKIKASTLSLTVLVLIEMFNSLNALSQKSSILDVGIFDNIWLISAIFLSLALHCFVLYVPALQLVFKTCELSLNDWMLVIGFSFPVVLIEELLKFAERKVGENGENQMNCCKKE